MSSEWSENYLSDLTDEITVGYVGSMTHEYADSGIPFLRSKNISNYEIVWDDIRYISSAFHNKIKKSVLHPGDVAVVRTGKPGTSCVIPNELSEGNCSDLVIIRVDKNKLCPHYLCYYLNSIAVHQIDSQIVGAVQQHFNVGSAKSLKIKSPSLLTQKRISFVLQCLDNKIKLNKVTNQTLEQIAQALFKSWFVDFEPVKAKISVLEAGGSQEDATLAAMTAISGKDADALAVFEREHPEQYAELKATAELFPSAMQDSELGEIPEGWSIKPLDGIATYQNGLALQKFRPENENDFLPVVKIAQLKKGFSDGEEKASPNIKPECIIDNGDVVFSWSGSLMVDIWCGGKAALNQHLFKVSSTKYPKWLYYKYTAHHLIEFQRIAEAKAVTMGHIKREHLSQAKCLMPSSETVHAFTPFFEPVLNKVISNRLETRKLENIRDTLLPKLLSGEITLPEAEQAVSEVENV
ncbi:restriction endonuclease subunit S [Enterobacter hormaechei subsp. xiangfangensis]|uniref:restriction endonuclease subunit S n=1 Tax=Enterobacteriaceae TaxID=543 RepID=UPI00100FB8D7|nr:restriction endonuclease subunit S [Cronobacter condimenti]HBL6082875.1 restriction endonuclease subunit S [Enterobacter hormaechei]HBL6105579.1 restriction endonuclease subunit S [Enterobacter hormaechei]HBL9173418.1 restriction endonuclease subunit S [Enterobacter hormaechei]